MSGRASWTLNTGLAIARPSTGRGCRGSGHKGLVVSFRPTRCCCGRRLRGRVRTWFAPRYRPTSGNCTGQGVPIPTGHASSDKEHASERLKPRSAVSEPSTRPISDGPAPCLVVLQAHATSRGKYRHNDWSRSHWTTRIISTRDGLCTSRCQAEPCPTPMHMSASIRVGRLSRSHATSAGAPVVRVVRDRRSGGGHPGSEASRAVALPTCVGQAADDVAVDPSPVLDRKFTPRRRLEHPRIRRSQKSHATMILKVGPW